MDRKRLIRELEALYRDRYRQFLRVVIAVVGDESAAHDVVQEGFARAIKSAGSYRGEGTVEAWLWRIVLNVARATPRAEPSEPLPDDAFGTTNGRLTDDEGAIRAWIAAGRFTGAYKLSERDWRVPLAGLDAFVASRKPAMVVVEAPRPVKRRKSRAGDGEAVDLGAWRRPT